jgi:repressor LexA
MEDREQLTKPQRLVLEAFRRRAHNGMPAPTYRELCAEFGWRSTGTARDHIRALARKGLLDRAAGKARATHLRGCGGEVLHLPLAGSVAAGHPVVTEEDVRAEMPIPAFMLPHGSGFLLRVRGDSMEGAGILDGDFVVVRKTKRASEGDVVVVTLDGETTLTRLVRSRGSWVLAPENPKYLPIEVATEEAVVQGVVTGVMRTFAGKGWKVS